MAATSRGRPVRDGEPRLTGAPPSPVTEEATQEAAEEVEFWRSGELRGLELLRATYVRHSFAPHTHETLVVGVIERGVETYRFRGRLQVATPGQIILVPPGEVHTGESPVAEGWTYRVLYPDVEYIREAVEQLGSAFRGLPEFRQSVVDDPALADQILRLHTSLAEPATALERRSRLVCVLAALVSRHGSGGAPPAIGGQHRAVRRAREYLDAHATENITLDQLANISGISMFQLVRVFRRELGLPPHAYQTERRIAVAKQLLREGMAAGSVAPTAGFYDQSHLTREFKRRVGLTPARYAQATRLSKLR